MVAVPRLLVVGLGNAPYPLTRHSVGHVVLDALAARCGVQYASQRDMKGFVAEASLDAGDSRIGLTLYKPKALMNITGPCVSAALKHTGILPASMVVVHDSLSHKPESISPKFGGSANGHNGVRSIISALGGTMDFHRLRIGIGREDGNVTAYVLGDLSSHERQFWSVDGQGSELVWDALVKISGSLSKPR